MANKGNAQSGLEEPAVYQIRLKGQLSSEWSEWFGGLSVTAEDDGVTLLSGAVMDQAALHGLLRKVRDLGMPLVAVDRVEAGREDAAHADAAQRLNKADLINIDQHEKGKR